MTDPYYVGRDGYTYTDPTLGELARLLESGESTGATVKAAAIDYAAGILAASAAAKELEHVEAWVVEQGDE